MIGTGKSALVTGATGAIGPSLVNQLLASDYTVRIYSRHLPADNHLPAKVTYFQGDINDPAALSQALSGVDVVFHLAALLHLENPPPHMANQYESINVAGTQNAMTCSIQAGVKRFVYFSTVKVYGTHQRNPVDEQTVPRPITIYAQTKLKGEHAVMAMAGKAIEPVILRLSAVYGPRLRGSWERMVKAIARGWFIPVGNLQNRRSMTYVEDVATVAQFVAEHPDAPGNIYNVVGHEAVSMYEIMNAIYKALGKRPPSLRLPAFLVVFSAFVIEHGLGLAGKRSPLTVDTIRQLIDDETYSGEKLRRLGLTYTSLDHGWQATIDAIQNPIITTRINLPAE